MNKDWNKLESVIGIDEIIEKSTTKPQIIFKHSTRCGISMHALSDLIDDWNLTPEKADFHLIDLLNFREISNEVANKLNVIHQSPQAIIIKNKEAVKVYTHSAIKFSKILDTLNND